MSALGQLARPGTLSRGHEDARVLRYAIARCVVLDSIIFRDLRASNESGVRSRAFELCLGGGGYEGRLDRDADVANQLDQPAYSGGRVYDFQDTAFLERGRSFD